MSKLVKKRCGYCGKSKPLKMFSMSKMHSFHRQPVCKACQSKKYRVYYKKWKSKRKRRENMKQFCCSCGEEKTFKEFYTDKSRKSGFDKRCKVCSRRMKRRNAAVRRTISTNRWSKPLPLFSPKQDFSTITTNRLELIERA